MAESPVTAVSLSPPKQNESPAPVSPVEQGRGCRKSRWIIGAILMAALFVVGRVEWCSHYFEETDNAYLDGHVTLVSPCIAGTVRKVRVKDNQWVNVGDLPVGLDQADQEIKVRKVVAQLANIDAQSQQSTAEVGSAKAEVKCAAAQARRAHEDAAREQVSTRLLVWSTGSAWPMLAAGSSRFDYSRRSRNRPRDYSMTCGNIARSACRTACCPMHSWRWWYE